MFPNDSLPLGLVQDRSALLADEKFSEKRRHAIESAMWGIHLLLQHCYHYRVDPLPSLRSMFGLKWRHIEKKVEPAAIEIMISELTGLRREITKKAVFVWQLCPFEFVFAYPERRLLRGDDLYIMVYPGAGLLCKNREEFARRWWHP